MGVLFLSVIALHLALLPPQVASTPSQSGLQIPPRHVSPDWQSTVSEHAENDGALPASTQPDVPARSTITQLSVVLQPHWGAVSRVPPPPGATHGTQYPISALPASAGVPNGWHRLPAGHSAPPVPT